MGDQTLNVLLFVLAVGTAIGSGIAYLFAYRKAKELTKLTSDLQQDVERLSRGLDQSINRLIRARDLINLLMEKALMLRQENRDLSDKQNIAVHRDMALPELEALINVIDDTELTKTFEQFAITQTNVVWEKLLNSSKYEPADMMVSDHLLGQQSQLTMVMLMRIYRLVEAATKDTSESG